MGLRLILVIAIAKAPSASDKYITTRTTSANPETKNVPNQSHPLPVCRNGALIPCMPPVTPRIMIAAKSGLTKKGGRGKGQQTGAVKPRNKIRFIDVEIELRLKQVLNNTPTEETNNALQTNNNIKGRMEVRGIQPIRLNTVI